MKDKKKLIIICGIIILFIIVGIVIFLLLNNKKQDNKKPEETKQNETYEMYVKINPLVKLVFERVYQECNDEDGNSYACIADESFNIVDYELVNNDAKNIYKDLDLFGVDLSDAIALLCDTAKDNNIDFNQVELTTDYFNFDNDSMIEEIKKDSKYHSEFNVLINIKDNINKDDLLTEEEKNEVKEYSVIFNSDGGSKVDTQILKEGEKVTKPKDPTKAGYDFVSWQLDGRDYNFDQEVKDDLKLKAVWKRNEQETTTKSTKTTTTTTTKATQKTEDPHKGYINLNDRVLYVEGGYCGRFSHIKDECIGKTYAELAAIYPNHDQFDDSVDVNEKLPGHSMFPYYSVMDSYGYFPACVSDSIPQSVQNKVNQSLGYKVDASGSVSFISFENSKYEKLMNENVLYNNGLMMNGGCGGGGGDITYSVLDESVCNKWNLKCDRW